MMTKRFFAWSALLLVLLASLAIGIFGLSGVRALRIEEAALQKYIDSQLPKTQKGVTIEKATLRLVGRDISITTTVTGSAFGQRFSLDAFGVGAPEYRTEKQAFYVHPTKLAVTRLDLTGESSADAASKLLDRYLTDPRIKQRVMGSLPGVKLWIEDNIVPRTLAYVGQMPLYEPKNDMKGIVIKATLSNIAVENGAVVLSFSILELTKTVLLCLAVLVASLGFAAVLLRNPGWGIPLALLS